MSDVMWVFEQGDWVSQVLAMVGALLWSALILRAWALRAPKTQGDSILGRFEGRPAGLEISPGAWITLQNGQERNFLHCEVLSIHWLPPLPCLVSWAQ